MPRVTFLTTGLALGGAEMQVVLLATSLKHQGWKPEVISMIPPVALTEPLAAESIPVFDLGMRRGVPDPRGLFRLRRLLRQSRPHVLHCHMVHANLLGRVARALAPVPVVISTAHSIQEGGRWRDLAYRLTDPLCDLLTQVSQAGAKRYCAENISAEPKTVWLPNGVDLARFQPDGEDRERTRGELEWRDRFLWIAVGNLREPKDYPNMLAAFAAVVKKRPEARLAIAGAGPLAASLERQAASLGLPGAVRFLGQRTDIPRLLSGADAYVLSSAWEGTPMALLEAAACSLPLVATAVGGNTDVIEEGHNGRMVPPHNPARLAEAMLAVMDMPAERRAAMGAAARAKAEKNYGHRAIVAKWDNIYRQLLSVKASESRQSGGGGFLPSRLRP